MILSWGKPRILVKDIDTTGSKWIEMPTPIEDTTNLTPTKGDKMEAKIEGGENEDVKYKRNTYAFTYDIRVAKGRKQPIEDEDGVVAHKYAVVLQPEDAANTGFYLEKTTVSLEDGFTSADGGKWTYTHDVLKPETGQQVKWGVVTITGEGESLAVTFKEDGSTGEATTI